MIVIDTSAIMVMALDEPQADECQTALSRADHLAISAGTLTELLIVAAGRGISAEVNTLLESADIEVVAVASRSARNCADAYRRWGKGFHPAALNFGDCFAYALARERDCPLLFVGNDFKRTDVQSALV